MAKDDTTGTPACTHQGIPVGTTEFVVTEPGGWLLSYDNDRGSAFGCFWCSLEEMIVFRGVVVCLDD